MILEKIVCMLHGHTGRVNCVRWIVNDLLASGAVDKNVIIWKCVDQANLKVCVGMKGVKARHVCLSFSSL